MSNTFHLLQKKVLHLRVSIHDVEKLLDTYDNLLSQLDPDTVLQSTYNVVEEAKLACTSFDAVIYIAYSTDSEGVEPVLLRDSVSGEGLFHHPLSKCAFSPGKGLLRMR